MRLGVYLNGLLKTTKRELNIIEGSNVTITIDDGVQNDAADITISAAGGAGHTIQNDDVSLTARTSLSFQDGFVTNDDAGGDQTEIDLDYGADITTQNYSDVAAAGTSVQIAREDHLHGMPAAGSGAPADADYLVGTANASLSAEIVVGTTPGGELGGTWASPTVDATHSGSTHSASTDTHIADTSAAHAASAVSADSTTLVGVGTTVQAVFEELDDAIVALEAPDYLVGTTTATLAGEIVVGTTPGGELGGTWGSPTVDATHSGSTHSAATDTHIADTADAHDASAISVLDTAAQITATDVEGALAEIVDASQTHEGAADPHTGYRLETADHTHASSGAQAGTIDHGAITGLTDDDHTQYRKETDRIHIGGFSKEGNLSTGTGTIRIYNDSGRTLTFVEIRAAVGTAPLTTDIIVDVNVDGTTIMTGTKVVIAASANTGSQTTFSTTTIADGSYITADIDQIGTGTVGADLAVTIWVTG